MNEGEEEDVSRQLQKDKSPDAEFDSQKSESADSKKA
jgi:hypothetical protein